MNDLTTRVLAFGIVMLFAIPLHEFAHAITAHWSGDDIPSLQHRVTPEPWAHWDPIGSALIGLGIFGGFPIIGWGKPVVTDPTHYRNGRWGRFMVASAGIVMNLLLAGIAAILYRTVPALHDDPFAAQLITYFVGVNCSLAIFNLLPIPPLDGSKMLSWLLPVQAAIRLDRMFGPLSWVLLYAIVFIGGSRLTVPVVWLSRHLLGS